MPTLFKRRALLRGTAAAIVAAGLRPAFAATPKRTARRPRILLRNGWQNVNIGDMGHYLGALELIERYFPAAEMTLWPRPGAMADGLRELVLGAFPRLKIVEGVVQGGTPSTPELAAAWEANDFMLHGSGSGFSARSDLAAWHRATGKPYGVFGTSTDPISGIGSGRDPEGGTLANLRRRLTALPANHLDAETRGIIDRASFMFCRDTLSLDYLKAQGVRPPILEFGPDSQFGMKRRDDALGDAFRRAHGLEEGKFICVIPRLRYTPYYRIRNERRGASDAIRDAINDRTTESDHRRVRDLIIAYVLATGHKVLACGEMTYQVPMAKEVLFDPLPAEVKRQVVCRDTFWKTYEAAAVFARSQAVICVDCHSPIIALTHGVPGFYVRQPTDTCKGQMFPDVGVGDWTFEVDETSGAEMWSRLERIVRDPAAARAHIQKVMTKVDARQRRMVEVLQAAVTG
jgi:polysaccharide pyruvyl transferase WcaK-like protein